MDQHIVEPAWFKQALPAGLESLLGHDRYCGVLGRLDVGNARLVTHISGDSRGLVSVDCLCFGELHRDGSGNAVPCFQQARENSYLVINGPANGGELLEEEPQLVIDSSVWPSGGNLRALIKGHVSKWEWSSHNGP